MNGTQNPRDISTKLEWIATMARENPERVFHSIGHVIDQSWLHEAYRRTRKDGARGVDGRSAADYATDLEGNLVDLERRLKSGTYRAPAVRHVEIPKASGGVRGLGIPTFEDKVLQRAVLMAMESIHEQDFLPCSYGFRPGRSAHGALNALWKELMNVGDGWVLEVDIESFFDSLSHEHLRAFLDQRVTDGTLRRVVHKWLKAGVMREQGWQKTRRGTPQGGVISPLLANVYLHHVLDRWFEAEVKPRLQGRATLIRYADDFVIVFAREADAHRVHGVLPKRFGKYDLRLHPEKTRLLPFGRSRKGCSFDFLGFTFHWGVSRQGKPVVRQKTAKSRFARAARRVTEWCRHNRHLPVGLQHARLSAMLRGHYSYFGVTGNGRWLERFYVVVLRTWFKWLSGRSNRYPTWTWYIGLLERMPLPQPHVVQSVYRVAKPTA